MSQTTNDASPCGRRRSAADDASPLAPEKMELTPTEIDLDARYALIYATVADRVEMCAAEYGSAVTDIGKERLVAWMRVLQGQESATLDVYAFAVYVLHALRVARVFKVFTVRNGERKAWNLEGSNVPVGWQMTSNAFVEARLKRDIDEAAELPLYDARLLEDAETDAEKKGSETHPKAICARSATTNGKAREALERLRQQALPVDSMLMEGDVVQQYLDCLERMRVYILTDLPFPAYSGPFGDEVFLSSNLKTDVATTLSDCDELRGAFEHCPTEASAVAKAGYVWPYRSTVLWHESAHNFVRYLRRRHHAASTQPLSGLSPCIAYLTAETLPSVDVSDAPSSLTIELRDVFERLPELLAGKLRAAGWSEGHWLHVEAGYFFDSAVDKLLVDLVQTVLLSASSARPNIVLCPFSGWPRRSD